ncbi:hypothetical protein [Vibrio owensii]|uniref:hypothetical protein n=1 Tax=Vibrio owensii TaxID=696485 RepID=UPI003AB0E237
MANTEHQETLDSLDKISVCLYRFGITLFAMALLVFSVLISGAISSSPLVYQTSVIALKESFCFKVPGLKMVPAFLAVATFALWFNLPILAAITMLLAGLVMGFLSFAKWRMPLHFDIGIKANYEI